MKKLYGVTIHFHVFDDSVNVVYGDRELLEKYLDLEIDKSVDGACFEDKEDGTITVWIGKTCKDQNLIAHESMHAVFKITNRRDLYWSDKQGEDEMICYMMGHLVGTIMTTKKNQWYVWNGKTKKVKGKSNWIKQK